MAIISGGNGVRTQGTAKPIIINGDCAVSQRTTSTTGVTSTSWGAVDRIQLVNNTMGTYTVIQEALTSGAAYLAGFHNAWRIDCTTADSSPASGDVLYPRYKIESQDLAPFRKGTSSAQKMTLAFWVKSNKTGNAQVNFYDIDNTRLCSGTYSISSADTWEHKIINIAADTTGAWADDNGEGLRIEWRLDSGSNSTSGATPTAWEAHNAADRDVAGALQIARNTANDWAMTGIQLEGGEFDSTTLPPFQHESYGDNLLRCQRYLAMNGNNAPITGSCNGSAQFNSASLWVPVSMRSTPSVANLSSIHCWFDDGTAFGDTSVSVANIKHIADTNSVYFNIDSLSGMTDNKMASGYIGTGSDSTKVQWDAEL